MFEGIEFANKEYLWALLVIPLILTWHILRQKRAVPEINLSSLSFLSTSGVTIRGVLRHLLTALRLIGLGLIIVAFARPQSSHSWEEHSVKGIDIVVVMDVSTSMLARDFEPNRLEVSKTVAKEFVDARKNDRFGFVIYEAQSYPSCPITTDHRVVKEMIDLARSGLMEGGTAIGEGLVSAVNRLKKSDASSKVAILLTDGVNNKGRVSPMTAATRAEEYGIRVYTIGVGSMGKAMTPVAMLPNGQYQYDMVPVEIDEKVMKSIAKQTGGKYFRATDKESLQNIYSEIDKMETNIRKVTEYMKKPEEFHIWVLIALAVFALEFILRYTILRTVP